MALLGSLIEGAAGVLGSALGGIFGKKSQDSANETNINLARETNALNERLFYENMQNQNLWNERAYSEYWKQRQYDSIANQRAMYEDAGINPYFALGNIEAGKGAGSTPSPAGGVGQPSMVTSQVKAFDPSSSIRGIGDSVAQGVNSYFVNSKLKSETVNQNIRNLTQLNRDIAEAEERLSAAKRNKSDTSKIEEEISVLKASKEYIVGNLKKQGKLLDAQYSNTVADTLNKDLQASAQQLNYDWQQKFNERQLKIMDNEVLASLARVHLTWYNASYYLAASLESAARKAGIDNQNALFKSTKDFLIQSVKNEVDLQSGAIEKSGAGLGLMSGRYNPLGMISQLLSGVFAGTGSAVVKGMMK